MEHFDGTGRHRLPVGDDVVAYTMCACGCQAIFPAFDKKGRPRRFISGHNSFGMSRRGQKGRTKLPRAHHSGYIRVFVPGHPVANRDGYALQHRLVLYEAGIDIPEGHQAHHVNGIKGDNRIENLEVLPESDHHKLHVGATIINQYGEWPRRNLATL